MTPDLKQFTQYARANPDMEYNALMGLLFRQEGLLDSFQRLAGNKAPGVDGLKKVDYAIGLENRFRDLSSRIRRLGYTPQPVRRVYIPKSDGGRRPLGVPAFEDRIVQDRLSQILQSIWEPEFLDCSFGFRPNRGALDALKRVDEILMRERVRFVVEADIKGFFNHVDHEWMLRFLKHRIKDERFTRTIQRFLKGGIMEDGVVWASEQGTPQGGLVSPVLSNIYLHYTLDLWFNRRFARSCRGRAFLVRYADDFLAMFEYKQDALLFRQSLEKRLGKFNLEVEPSKTQLLEFGIHGAKPLLKQESWKPRTFNFLGFTHFITRSRNGRPIIGRKTQRERMWRKLKELKIKLRIIRTLGTHEMLDYIIRHVRGHLHYYGISGNMRSLVRYCWHVRKLLFKWLNRRSQRKSLTWEKYQLLLKSKRFPLPYIVHQFYRL